MEQHQPEGATAKKPSPVLGKISDISIAFRNAWQVQQTGIKDYVNRQDEVARQCRQRYRKLELVKSSVEAEMRMLEAQEAVSSEAAALGEKMNNTVENDVLRTMRALDAVGSRSTLHDEQIRLLATLEQVNSDHAKIDAELAALEQYGEEVQSTRKQLAEREQRWVDDTNALEQKRAQRIKEVKDIQQRERQATHREESITKWQKMLDVRENDNLRTALQVERKLDRLLELERSLGNTAANTTTNNKKNKNSTTESTSACTTADSIPRSGGGGGGGSRMAAGGVLNSNGSMAEAIERDEDSEEDEESVDVDHIDPEDEE